jgi:hypothetical protein
MASRLDPDRMRDIVMRHSTCELGRDWKGALATMVATPIYEFYPYRLRLTSPAAIIDAWARMLPLPCCNPALTKMISHEEYVGESGLLHVSAWTFPKDGETRMTKVAVKYAFEGDLMSSETMFMDAAMMTCVDAVFDAKFRSSPGVESI